MDLRTLRAFVEVVRQGGFSQAAKTVHATQSTVSKAVRQLEDEIGMPLIDRLGHGTRLTSAGELVYPRAVRLLAERDDLLAELAELRGLRRGTLRLGVPPVGSSTIFAPLFAAYRARYPGIEVSLVEYGADRLLEVLGSGELDLAATLLPVTGDFLTQEVRREPLMALLPRDHELATHAVVTLPMLRTVPFVLFGAGFAINRIVGDACRRHGFEPTVAARSSQIDFIVELVGAGLGVAFLPRMIAEARGHPRVIPVLLSEEGTDWHLAMIWRRSGFLSHAATAWLDLARRISAPEGVEP